MQSLYTILFISISTAPGALLGGQIGFHALAPGQLPETVNMQARAQLAQQLVGEAGIPAPLAQDIATAHLILPGAPDQYPLHIIQYLNQGIPLRPAVYRAITELLIAPAQPLPENVAPAAFRRIWQYATDSYQPLAFWLDVQEHLHEAPFPAQALYSALRENANAIMDDGNFDEQTLITHLARLLPGQHDLLWQSMALYLQGGLTPEQSLVQAELDMLNALAGIGPILPGQQHVIREIDTQG